MSAEHALIAVKGSSTLDCINMRVASRLREVVILLFLSTRYAASGIVHTVFSFPVQEKCLQTGWSSGEATEMVLLEHLSCEERLGELFLVILELRRL